MQPFSQRATDHAVTYPLVEKGIQMGVVDAVEGLHDTIPTTKTLTAARNG